MSLDKLLADLANLPTEIQNLKAELRELKNELRNREAVRPSYDYKQLMSLGYSKDEAYTILRSHGVKRNGRFRVTADNLIAYQKGEGRDALPLN
jgi:AmiR/NasT family two-component response regulator